MEQCAAARARGKIIERQIIKMKLEWVQERGNAERRRELMVQMEGLKVGTQHLGSIISTKKFVTLTAGHVLSSNKHIIVRRAFGDADTSEQEVSVAKEFLLQVFVEGKVRGRGRTLTCSELKSYYARLESEDFCCTHTGRSLHFFTSRMPDQASPDRLRPELPYFHEDQVTVRSSLWANYFFGDVSQRDTYLLNLSRPYVNQEQKLDFTSIFSSMDGVVETFLATSPDRRADLQVNPDGKLCSVSESFVQHHNVKFGGRHKLRCFFNAFHSRCIVSGLGGGVDTLSVDRKIDATGFHILFVNIIYFLMILFLIVSNSFTHLSF
jgi:hypothetical protein